MATVNTSLIQGCWFDSANVKVFPCAYRGQYEIVSGTYQGHKYTFDPEAMLNTEYNLTHTSGVNNIGKSSYIIEYALDGAGSSLGTLKCVIGGYYFEITSVDLDMFIDATTTTKKAKNLYIKFANIDIKDNECDSEFGVAIDSDRKSYVLQSWDSEMATLDVPESESSLRYYFTGIKCLSEAPTHYDACLKVIQQEVDGTVVLANNHAQINFNAYLPSLYHGSVSNTIVTNEDNLATGKYSLGEGRFTCASGEASHAEGLGAIINNITKYTEAKGIGSHAEGYCTKTTAAAKYSHAEGQETTVSGMYAHAEGYKTTAAGNGSKAIGTETKSSGNNSIAAGDHSTANGTASISVGKGTIANGNNSIANGYYTNTIGENSITTGSYTETLGKNAIAGGTNTIAAGTASIAFGEDVYSNGLNSIALGKGNKEATGLAITAKSIPSSKEQYIELSGDVTDKFKANTAYLIYNTEDNKTNNLFYVDSIRKIESAGAATVTRLYTKLPQSVIDTIKVNYTIHNLVGYATGDYSHAEGIYTTATGTGAIAVGNKSNAVGNYSIAAGTESTSNGECSIAIGKANIANSNGSIALGNNTKATKEYQTVLGKFNAETDGEFIVGIGENNDKRNNALVVNNTTTTIKSTVTIKNNDDSPTHNFSPTTTEINTATNTVNGTTNTIVGTTNTLKVSDVEKIAVNATNTAITNTNITATADVFKVCKSTTEKLKINNTDTTVNNTNVTINATKFAVTATDATTPIKLTGKTSIVGNTDITGTLSSTENIHIGNNSGAAKSIIYKTFNGSQEEVLRFISSSTANYGAGVVVGGNGTTAIVSGEGGKTPTTDWNDENLYLSADAHVFISTNTDSGWDSRKSWQFNAAGNLICPGYIDSVINTTAANDSVKELVKAAMASNDYFRILVGGKDDAGYVEIATADNGNEPIYVRQYSGADFGTISNSITLLDASGNTTLPKSLTIGDASRTSVIGTNGNGLVVSTAVGENWNIELTNIAPSGSNEASICYNAFDKNSAHGSWVVGQGCGAAGDSFAWYWYPNSTVRTGAENKAYLTKDGEFNAYTFNAKSDKRLKENVIEYKSEKSILDLPVYKFDFIDGPKNQIGCLAQDLQEICPEIVKENENGYLSITESKLVYLLLNEVKQLRKELNLIKEK